MNLYRIKAFSRIYLIAVLLVGVLFPPLPYSGIALGFVAIQLFFIYQPPTARVNLTVCLLTLILLPLALEPVIGGIPSALLVLPALPLLDASLRENAGKQDYRYSGGGVRATPVLEALAIALLLVLVASLLLANFTLTLTVGLLAGYLLGVLAYIFFTLPHTPLSEFHSHTRVIAGNKIEVGVTLHNRSRIPLYLHLSTLCPWIDLHPSG